MKLADIKIRKFIDEDYRGLTALNNMIEPDFPMTEKEFRHWDETRDPKCFMFRIVAEHDAEIVASGSFRHNSYMFHPDKYNCNVQVAHKYRKIGLGSAVFEQLLNKLAERNAITIRGEVKENEIDGMQFAKKNGLIAETEEWESRADPRVFDFEKYDGLFVKLKNEGIGIINLTDMLEHDQNAKQNLHKLSNILAKDVPSPEEYTKSDFEPWEKQLFEAPNLLPEAFLIAKKDNEYLALHSLWGAEAKPTDVIIGMTGVKREWRARGIAKALKVANTNWAVKNGYQQIITWNNSENVEILKINNEFGFVRQPAWIGFKKEL